MNARTLRVLCAAGCALSILIVAGLARSADETSAAKGDARAEAQAALEDFNGLIGGWRGAAQPVRGSNKGAWIEKAEWLWEIKKDVVGIRYNVTGGKALQTALLTYDPEGKKFHIHAVLADKTERDYAGELDGRKLVLSAPADEKGVVHRITLTPLSEKRTLVLLEQRPADTDRFVRVVEVGYTREGTSLAEEGADGPECIVTGGKGTSSTVYKGKTYWFCCTGCRDAFDDDPDAVIAQAAERAAKKKAARK